MLKVFYSIVMYDYNEKARGFSMDPMKLSLSTLPEIQLIPFDCSDFGNMQMRAENNRKLLELIDREKPDIFQYVAFTDQISKETLKYIKERTSTTSINWFCDDVWRFDQFTKEMCWLFDYSICVEEDALIKYEKIGYKNVILSQWATNISLYPKMNLPFKYDVSFVGQPHGFRREIIAKLEQEGIRVATFGYGWRETPFKRRWNKRYAKYPFLQFNKGRISHDEMIRIFNQSKINLNLSASSHESAMDQMKARNFEVPSCGGFLLTGKVPHLENFFDIGKEVAVYTSIEEMIEKIRYYLAHEEERQRIANAGYLRTLRDHTYENRFRDIYGRIKLKNR